MGESRRILALSSSSSLNHAAMAPTMAGTTTALTAAIDQRCFVLNVGFWRRRNMLRFYGHSALVVECSAKFSSIFVERRFSFQRTFSAHSAHDV